MLSLRAFVACKKGETYLPTVMNYAREKVSKPRFLLK
jgi:hypothetical protein